MIKPVTVTVTVTVIENPATAIENPQIIKLCAYNKKEDIQNIKD